MKLIDIVGVFLDDICNSLKFGFLNEGILVFIIGGL